MRLKPIEWIENGETRLCGIVGGHEICYIHPDTLRQNWVLEEVIFRDRLIEKQGWVFQSIEECKHHAQYGILDEFFDEYLMNSMDFHDRRIACAECGWDGPAREATRDTVGLGLTKGQDRWHCPRCEKEIHGSGGVV
jgi:hypothetical protein